MAIRIWQYNGRAHSIELHVDGQPAYAYPVPKDCAEGLGLIGFVLRNNEDITRDDVEALTTFLLRFTPGAPNYIAPR